MAPSSATLPGIKHADPVGDAVHYAEVVRDEKHAELAPAADFVEQVEDARLDRDVERGRRFVKYDEGGVAHERGRDQHALLHAAGELMRIGARPARRDPVTPTSASAATARSRAASPERPRW